MQCKQQVTCSVRSVKGKGKYPYYQAGIYGQRQRKSDGRYVWYLIDNVSERYTSIDKCKREAEQQGYTVIDGIRHNKLV